MTTVITNKQPADGCNRRCNTLPPTIPKVNTLLDLLATWGCLQYTTPSLFRKSKNRNYTSTAPTKFIKPEPTNTFLEFLVVQFQKLTAGFLLKEEPNIILFTFFK
jgi:hypothetical protein